MPRPTCKCGGPLKKNGRDRHGKQRLRCCECGVTRFGEGADTVNRLPEFKESLIRELLSRGFGVREAARLAGVDKHTVAARYAAMSPVTIAEPCVTDFTDKTICHWCGAPVHGKKQAARRTARTYHVFCGIGCRRAFTVSTDDRAMRNYIERHAKYGGRRVGEL